MAKRKATPALEVREVENGTSYYTGTRAQIIAAGILPESKFPRRSPSKHFPDGKYDFEVVHEGKLYRVGSNCYQAQVDLFVSPTCEVIDMAAARARLRPTPELSERDHQFIAQLAAIFEGSEYTRTDTGAKGRTTKAEAFREAEQLMRIMDRKMAELRGPR